MVLHPSFDLPKHKQLRTIDYCVSAMYGQDQYCYTFDEMEGYKKEPDITELEMMVHLVEKGYTIINPNKFLANLIYHADIEVIKYLHEKQKVNLNITIKHAFGKNDRNEYLPGEDTFRNTAERFKRMDIIDYLNSL